MSDFIFGLNTSTIQPVPLLEKIRICGEAGYQAIELWINEVEDHVAAGKPLAEVRRALDDAGLSRPSMISLRDWCVAEEEKFAAALDVARRRLELAAALGVTRIVAGPPREEVPLELATRRYRRLLEVSLEFGVPASVEFLGFVEGINTLEDAWAICGGTGRAEGTITPDAWHMFRGDSNFALLEEIPAEHISCFHWNDAPAQPPRTEQNDSHRVYPGDGIMNLAGLAGQLRKIGFQGALTLELFNRDYWARDAREVARVGLEKMKASVG